VDLAARRSTRGITLLPWLSQTLFRGMETCATSAAAQCGLRLSVAGVNQRRELAATP